MTIPNEPFSRKEQYLSKIAGDDHGVPAKPFSREEQYLAAIAENGGGGGIEYVDLTISAQQSDPQHYIEVVPSKNTDEIKELLESGKNVMARLEVPVDLPPFSAGVYTLPIYYAGADAAMGTGAISGGDGVTDSFYTYSQFVYQGVNEARIVPIPMTYYIDSRIKIEAGAPTTSTPGTLGQLWIDNTGPTIYILSNISGSTYTWTNLMA